MVVITVTSLDTSEKYFFTVAHCPISPLLMRVSDIAIRFPRFQPIELAGGTLARNWRSLDMCAATLADSSDLRSVVLGTNLINRTEYRPLSKLDDSERPTFLLRNDKVRYALWGEREWLADPPNEGTFVTS